MPYVYVSNELLDIKLIHYSHKHIISVADYVKGLRIRKGLLAERARRTRMWQGEFFHLACDDS